MKFLLVVVVLGVVVYLAVRIIQRRGGSAVSGRPPAPKPPGPRRPFAPDDDSDFLREIDRKKRRHQDDPDT